jgi:anti-sigma factor RsiW
MEHIQISKLLDRAEGKIAADERDVAAHLSVCRECRAEAAKLEDFFAFAMDGPAEQVPQAVTARLLNIYDRKPAPTPETRRSRSATLVFDDWQMALNERYSGLDTRQLLYSILGFDLDLRIELVGEKCLLTGQMFPAVDGAMVELVSVSVKAKAKAKAKAFSNDLGEFVFDAVPQDTYDLTITLPDEDITIERVPLRT